MRYFNPISISLSCVLVHRAVAQFFFWSQYATPTQYLSISFSFTVLAFNHIYSTWNTILLNSSTKFGFTVINIYVSFRHLLVEVTCMGLTDRFIWKFNQWFFTYWKMLIFNVIRSNNVQIYTGNMEANSRKSKSHTNTRANSHTQKSSLSSTLSWVLANFTLDGFSCGFYN